MNKQNNSKLNEVESSKNTEPLIESTTSTPKNSSNRKRLSDEVNKGVQKRIKKMLSSENDDKCEEPGPLINTMQINEENCVENDETSTCHNLSDKVITRAQSKLLEAQKNISGPSNYQPENQHISLKKLLEKDETSNFSNTELGKILSSDNNYISYSTKNKVCLSLLKDQIVTIYHFE
uniref:Uncharacterized protein n=1 Tax=Parastrongyloides trichosuri TaxID=131310 RepID=A0A0N4ZQN8_PARTI